MRNQFMAKVYLPQDLAPHIWALAGNDSTSLREGILKACRIAVGLKTNHENFGNNNCGPHSV